MKGLIACCFLLLASGAMASIRDVDVTSGSLRGTFENGISIFRGIPFAKPPVGPLRWKEPQAVVPWRGIRSADKFAAQCMQGWDRGSDRPSEDCLYLNVWTAAVHRDERRPVMVWIHGGGFAGGMSWETISHGQVLAREGVVVVTVAYRLGAFGFLTSEELAREAGGHSGNYGLWDIVAALRWVQENISQFGGDPSRVTIFGGSSGAAAVSLLVASPVATGLFSRAIAQGGAEFFLQPDEQLKEHSERAKAIGRETFAQLNAKDLKAARQLSAEAIQQGTLGWPPKFTPVIDGNLVRASANTQYEKSRVAQIPILIGYTSDEAGDQTPEALEFAREQVDRFPCKELAAEIRARYSLDDPTKAGTAVRYLFRDFGTGLPIWNWAHLHSNARHPTYVYFFDLRNDGNAYGAPHASEYSQVFGNFPPNATQKEKAVSALIRKYWINFASTGDPNGSALPTWSRFEPDAPRVMVLDESPRMSEWPNEEGIRALERGYECLSREPR